MSLGDSAQRLAAEWDRNQGIAVTLRGVARGAWLFEGGGVLDSSSSALLSSGCVVQQWWLWWCQRNVFRKNRWWVGLAHGP